jgi:hypothetical protein
LTLTSPRHSLQAAFLFKKFLEKIINLIIIKKSADLGKIRQGPPPKLVTCEFASNLPLFSQIRLFFHKAVAFSENPMVWAPSHHWGWGGEGLGRHLVPPLLAVNSSWCLGLFIDVRCPS